MKYFDAHCHIQEAVFDEDRSDLIAALQEQEIGGIIVGVDYESSKRAVTLAEGNAGLYASVGQHPTDTPNEPFDRSLYGELLRSPKAVAIGECGLDNYRGTDSPEEKDRQRSIFEEHIHLAIETQKPLMIHARPSKGTMDAYQDLISILKSYKHEYGEKLRGNVHFFVGGVSEARELIDLNFTLSYTAVVTFVREYDDVIRFAPMTHLISETDSPYVAPAPNRGKRNDPRAIPAIVEALAGIRKEDSEQVRVQILQNVQRVFSIPLETS